MTGGRKKRAASPGKWLPADKIGKHRGKIPGSIGGNPTAAHRKNAPVQKSRPGADIRAAGITSIHYDIPGEKFQVEKPGGGKYFVFRRFDKTGWVFRRVFCPFLGNAGGKRRKMPPEGKENAGASRRRRGKAAGKVRGCGKAIDLKEKR